MMNPPGAERLTPRDIHRAFSGDLDARRQLAELVLEVVYREVAATLVPLASHVGRDPRQDVDDLTQSVMVMLFEHGGRVLKTWDPARGMGLSGFVALVARRRVLRTLSGFRGNLWAVTPVPSEQLERVPRLQADELADVDHALELDATLARLDAWLNDRGRRLFRAIYVEQRDIKDVCVDEGMTADAIHAWCARVRNKVRELTDRGVSPRTESHPPRRMSDAR